MPSTRMRVVLALAEADTDAEGSRVEAYKMKLLKCIWFWKANLIQLRIYAGNVITGSKKGKIAGPCRAICIKLINNARATTTSLCSAFQPASVCPPPGHTSLSRLAQAVSVSWRRHTAPLSGQTDNASAICKGLRIQRPSAGVRPSLTDALSASHSVHPFAGLPGCLPVWSTLLIWICSSGAEERTYNFNCQHW